MKFRTEIDIRPFETKIDYESRILAMGSCFVEAVGGRLAKSKFGATINPTGVLFNPASICRALERFERCEGITAEELREGAQGWFHYDFHSSLSDSDPAEALSKINRAVEVGHNALEASDWVIITLGTSWIYELSEGGEVVANCHKQPGSRFRRRRLSVAEVVEYLDGLLQGTLRSKRVILTLSPIRHVADGLSENSLSKATLRVAIEEIVERYANRVYYFPSFEILMDDLRDYRFYGDDLVHPSSTAVEYVWQSFCGAAISAEANDVMGRVMAIVRAAEHRPRNPQSESFGRFCEDQLRAISRLEGVVEMPSEREYFVKGAKGVCRSAKK